ncbi:hypothetical protein F751_0653 [Auxenochlorella protothecoides]|uniref:Uncharacterized protein n=1 Tax=Auxenochlorella protothecoides TaxID=3075 RepID=A0A087SQG3_AUXPR|nr:hypothetical protein F751_0653 [Auxenochlorella protothecoides]KFM27967.1 hypothetical protein F751_0653 [Auxenochlorella protothecoides]
MATLEPETRGRTILVTITTATTTLGATIRATATGETGTRAPICGAMTPRELERLSTPATSRESVVLGV